MDLFLGVLQSALTGRPLPRGEAAGVVVFRASGLVERTAVVELAADGCRARIADAPAKADLVVWSSRQGFDDLVTGADPAAPLRVDGDAALLRTLARMLEGGGGPLATRLAAAGRS